MFFYILRYINIYLLKNKECKKQLEIILRQLESLVETRDKDEQFEIYEDMQWRLEELIKLN